MNYEPDNIIQWIFEKMFDQITTDGKDFFIIPYEIISQKTFHNDQIHQIIYDLTKKPIAYIKDYIYNNNFKQYFLFIKLKKKLHVQILMNNLERFTELVNSGYQIDYKCYQLASLNNRINILKYIAKIKNTFPIHNDLLFYCCEFGYEEIYFHLRNLNLMPNISIYNKAILGGSMKIIRDISEYIGLTDNIISNGVQTNNTEIIKFLFDVAEKENLKIDKNLIAYPILNCNMELIDFFNKKITIIWHHELYYSAILSGSMDMIKYVESKIPDIHENRILDSSRTKKGKASILIDDTIYHYGEKKYFSHTINYAIQSGSVEILEYLHQKGYGITPSNFITAIRQGTPEILQYLCDNYHKKLPFYLLHYLSIYSYISNKILKTKILYDSELLTFGKDNFNLLANIEPTYKLTTNDYRKESIHLQLISESVYLTCDGKYDIDWLMKYYLFFIPMKGFKLNRNLLTKIRFCLVVNNESILETFFKFKLNKNDQQLIIDALFLFGTIDQIKKYYPLVIESKNERQIIMPSIQIIMEILCYGQLNKICYLMQFKFLDNMLMEKLYPLLTMISDTYIYKIAEKMNYYKPNLKYLVRSKKVSVINEYIDKYPELLNEKLDKDTIKELLIIDNLDLVKKFNIPTNILFELLYWSREMDLLELVEYINKLVII